MGLPRAITLEDFMPILNKIIPIAFVRVKKNKNAASERGWFPTKFKLLDRPEFHNCEKIQSKMDINTTNGMGASVLDAIIQQRLVPKASKMLRRRGKMMERIFKNGSRKQEKLHQVFSMLST